MWILCHPQFSIGFKRDLHCFSLSEMATIKTELSSATRHEYKLQGAYRELENQVQSFVLNCFSTKKAAHGVFKCLTSFSVR